ncbi:hypothetical protein AD998_17815 [bacterium 336/3]|nr:hypothetical protein AD998_17815 [bacterium 336/3]
MKKMVFLQCLLIVFINIVFAQNRLIRFQEKGKWGLYDENSSKAVLGAKYDRILPIKSGFIAYDYGENEGRNFWIDSKGKEYLNLWVKGTDFYDGLLLCENTERNNETTYINEKGDAVITGYYDQATDFSEGVALVSTGGNTMGGYDDSKANVFFIDTKGNTVFSNVIQKSKIKISFDQKSKFVNGRVFLNANSQDSYYILDKKGKILNIQNIIKKHDKSLKNEQKGLFYINPIDFDLYDGGLLVAKTFNQSEELKLLMFDEKYNVLFPKEHIVSASNLLNGKRLLVMLGQSRKFSEYSDPIQYYKYVLINEKNKVIKEIINLSGTSFVLYQFPDNKVLAYSNEDNQVYLLDEKLNIIFNQKSEFDQQKVVITLSNTKETYVMPLIERKTSWDREPYGGGEIDAFKLPNDVEKILSCNAFTQTLDSEGYAKDSVLKRDVDCGNITTCTDCIILFKKNGKIGAFDHTGKIIIPAEYDDFFDNFKENNRAIAKKNGKWGEISRNNTIVAPFKIEDFNLTEYVPFTKIDGKWGVDGLLPHEYDECPQTVEAKVSENTFLGTYITKKNGKYGLIDVIKSDRTVLSNILPYEYDKIDYNIRHQEGLAEKNGKKYYFNAKGINVPFEYNSYKKTYFKGEYDTHLIVIKNNNQGILRLSDNKLVIPCEYEQVEIAYYKSDYAYVKKNGKYGIISLENKILVPCEFDYVKNEYSEKGAFFIVEKNKKQGLMSANKYLIPLNYDELGRFYNDPAIPVGVKKGNKWGFVDKQFKQILPFEYEEDAEGIVSGFEMNTILSPKKDFSTAILRKNGKYGIVDSKGKILIPFEYDSIDRLWFSDADSTKPIFSLLKNANSKSVEVYWDGKKLITKS